ncbi:PREDICTED: probable palmitoyltransferase ZDHHC24 [Polistes dominula]|uniref:Palmitoyltransferase n=1 Tax=Polistes dominula TaxID=743375 RepID=A0ABM1I685_POLDO|nr:PREDICTED: probable palmitoyltransferase ZDHHC24 [Polistes dominula]
MIIRKMIWPRTFSDFASMVFILTIVPLIYWFELWIVLPALYKYNTIPYLCHFILGNFIMLNIVGNFTYTVLCDTSINRTIVPVSTANSKDGWRLCTTCEILAPPRSWHCSTCKTCILKRDHHCIFTGCCVGYFNHRYFIMFLLYLFIATVYAFCYNNFFIWSRIHFEFPMSIIKIIFPLAIFVFGFDGSIEQFYLLLYIVSVIGMLFTGILCIYHFQLVFNGCVADESNKNKRTYDLGWRQNIKEVLGERWYLTWLVPYIKSQLPHDGITWDTKSQWKMNNAKSK